MHTQTSSCIFCKIINNEISAKIVAESDHVLCIKDLYPKASIHYLLIPKMHIPSVHEIPLAHQMILVDLLCMIQKIQQIDSSHAQYRLITNNGLAAGQTIFHMHIHFLAGAIIPPF